VSEVLCSRINDNLINLDREYQIVRSDLGKARSKLDDLEPGLADAENRLNALLPSLPERLVGRSPAGRLGSLASSVFDAVATENARANTQGQVDRLRAQVGLSISLPISNGLSATNKVISPAMDVLISVSAMKS